MITRAPGYMKGKRGEQILFSCNFSGDPELAVTWGKDGVMIQNENRFRIIIKKGYSEVQIENALYSDGGTYQVTLANAHSNAIRLYHLYQT